MIITEPEIESLLKANHGNPHALLGNHPLRATGKSGKRVFRAFLQDAVTCEVINLENDERHPMKKVHPEGIFEGVVKADRPFPYRLRIERENGEVRQFYDPYGFQSTLSEQDLYLFNEGTELQVYNKLGAHIREIDSVKGVSFAVWAPNAERVSVVGDFNLWDGRFHPMRRLGASGIWELFVPGLTTGNKYKYEIYGKDGNLRLKTDPYGMYFEPPPHNASIIWDYSDYQWNDREWIEARSGRNWNREPISVYEVHFGSWKRVVEDGNRPLTYREMAVDLARYVRERGFTHVEFLPLAEHPFSGSWGYQVTGFFAPTSRYGTPQDFMYLVDEMHRHGIGVLIDWVPGHFPKDAFALAEFDGTHLYEHADPRQGHHEDWGTLIFNYGRHEVRSFLIASALSWLDRFHVDGFRVDAVASMLYLDYSRENWIPNEYGGNENLDAIRFLRKTNDLIHQHYPGTLTIAEESTSYAGVSAPTKDGGLGFDLKWNMGWMHDTLEFMKQDPLFRKYHLHQLTFAMIYQYSEKFVLVFSHDEVVHMKGSMLNKMPLGAIRDKSRNLRALYGFMWFWPGKKTLFMGDEFGQSAEWKYDHSLDWHLLQYKDHEGILQLVGDLNHFYRKHPALSERDFDSEGFQWINGNDADQCVVSFLRMGDSPGDTFAIFCNFTPVLRRNYRGGVPYSGFWKEVLNTDSEIYGGDNHGNAGGVMSESIPWDGRDDSVAITIPGLSALVFQFQEPEG